MPPGGHHHDHGGHYPRPPFGNWGWGGMPVQYVEVERDETAPPLWVWIVGGAALGMLLAAITRNG